MEMGWWAEWTESAEWAEWADWAEVTKWTGLHVGWGGEWLAGWKRKGPVEGREVVRRKRRRTMRGQRGGCAGGGCTVRRLAE